MNSSLESSVRTLFARFQRDRSVLSCVSKSICKKREGRRDQRNHFDPDTSECNSTAGSLKERSECMYITENIRNENKQGKNTEEFKGGGDGCRTTIVVGWTVVCTDMEFEHEKRRWKSTELYNRGGVVGNYGASGQVFRVSHDGAMDCATWSARVGGDYNCAGEEEASWSRIPYHTAAPVRWLHNHILFYYCNCFLKREENF